MSTSPNITVVGAGLMGHAIAQVFAAHGHLVAIYDPDSSMLASVHDRIFAICKQLNINTNCTTNITTHRHLETAIKTADFIIEAAPEKLELKQSLVDDILTHCPKHTVLATNSSVIPVTKISAKLANSQAERLVGSHFWNPPYLIPIVEVIQGERSNQQAIDKVIQLLRSIGKKAVHIKKDVVIGNRFQHALWREAMAAVDANICDAQTADTIIKNTLGLRLGVLGPLENADLIGLDLCQDIHNVVLPQLNTSHKPIRVLEEKVENNALGMKSGKGFYDWTPARCESISTQLTAHLISILNKGDASEIT